MIVQRSVVTFRAALWLAAALSSSVRAAGPAASTPNPDFTQGGKVPNGHDPRLTQKVHIPQAADLLSREVMLKHPAVILHELAHAYHDQSLGFDHPEIKAAYEQAKASGSYDKVLSHTGKKVRHYALTTPQEYFAEATEAYFYRNDFFPFVRAELMEHDPALFALLEKIWDSKTHPASRPQP